MPSPARLLDGRFNTVLFQLPLKFEQSLDCSVEVTINRDPLAPLGLGVDREQVDGHVAV
ncbi:hypothetical protein ACPOL_6184 [Acidisarcina polymorpha]|uniref:Uncharacterized protein n=1 Tax=Acidisarcina polymorpha TaxID=2211140 RepID=A0A2Z5G8X9_9BACT|nr:hypothetical protein ACPOL_6184 [Acidisarcina polymorpha]